MLLSHPCLIPLNTLLAAVQEYIVYLHTQMGFKRDSRFAFSPSPGVEDRCIFQIKKWGGLGGKEGIMALAKKENHKKSNNTSIKCRFFGAEKSV